MQYSGIVETQTLIQVLWGVTLFCWVVPDVSKGLGVFMFKGDGVAELLTQPHGVTSQKTRILSSSVLRTSDLAVQECIFCQPDRETDCCRLRNVYEPRKVDPLVMAWRVFKFQLLLFRDTLSPSSGNGEWFGIIQTEQG